MTLPSIDATPEPATVVAAQCDSREILTSQASIDAAHSPSGGASAAAEPSSLRTSNLELRTSPLVFAPTDPVRFGKLAEAARDHLNRTLKALEWIHREATKPKGLSIKKAADIMALKCLNAPGFSPSRLRTKYYLFRDSRDWTVLVEKRLAGPQWWQTDEPLGLPGAFIEFWKSLCESNQRKCKPAHRELKKIWRTRADSRGKVYKQIPGYTDWPAPDATTDLPRGWEYSNLNRYAPDDFELAAARQGRFAASKHRRKVFTTREGLQVMQFCFFDDQVYDAKVLFTSSYGQASRPMRPRGYDALDLASACFVGHLFKPTLLNPDAPERELHLSSKKEFPWFVTDVLLNTGYNPVTKTVFVCERGTASIDQALEERLFNATGGLVIVDRSGLVNRASHAALFDGASKGNPRFKAPLESLYQLVRNNTALLPGQTGKDRDHCPDDLHGRERYDARLVRCLTPELLQQAIRPFMEWSDFIAFVLAVYTAIDARIDHDLEGWRKNKALEWRITPSAPWMSMAEFERLPVPQQMSLTELFRGPHGSALNRSRKLSPREVFNTSAKALHRLSPDLVPYVLSAELGTERTIRDGYIEINDQELSSDPLRFPAFPLRNGEKYNTYLINVAADVRRLTSGPALVLADSSNRFVTTLTLQTKPSRADLEGVKREMAAVRKEESDRLKPLEARHHAAAVSKAAMHRHNSGLAQTASGHNRTDRATDRAIDSALAENSDGGPSAAAEALPDFNTQKDYE